MAWLAVNMDSTMQPIQPVEQQSLSIEPSLLAVHWQCFYIITKLTPCLHQSVKSAVTRVGLKDLIPFSTLSAITFFVGTHTSSISQF